jgi:hypothetical protein
MWKGRWDIPFNPIPYPCEYLVGVGKPISISIVKGMEDDKAIEFLMVKYIAEVERLFEKLKKTTGRRKDATLEVERLKRREERK